MALHTSFLRFLKDKKGQEFSVFKLLISAVIAVTILGVLFSIIFSIIPPGQGEPEKLAGKTVVEIMNDNGTQAQSTPVDFVKDSVINTRNVSSATNGVLTSNEVCLSTGAFSENPNWEQGPEGVRIAYRGSDTV